MVEGVGTQNAQRVGRAVGIEDSSLDPEGDGIEGSAAYGNVVSSVL